MTARLLVLIIGLCQGCPPQAVRQSGPVTVDRGSSVKLSCHFSMRLRLQKPSLTWVRKDENDAETTIYPSDGSTDATRASLDAEAFKISMDAGINLRDLRQRDSGRYFCCVTILSGGVQKECRGNGTHLTVRAAMYDTPIACSPLGVVGAALLVLHGMVYKQWMEYRKVHVRQERHWRQ
ncbi:natural cytotoxicity triggering receptor 3 [Ranitomeya variabilis]|uniref:natural cytotoxicity triggering receptor 3 n=1 Tax=Ranitomeya variabilis TaxID=490064 RepID=UPI004056274C